ARPRHDVRGHGRRRQARPPARRLRPGLQPERHRAWIWGHLALLDAEPRLHPVRLQRGQAGADRQARDRPRRVEPERGQAQYLQQPHLGPGRVAVRVQWDSIAVEGRPPRNAGEGSRRDELRRLALPPDAKGVRGGRPRDDQPIRARLRRVRRAVHHELRDQAPVPRHPGCPLRRNEGQDINPHSYALMGSIADYIHWAGGDWTTSRTGKEHSDAGGGHAHVGAMIYLGDNFPDEYRNSLLTCNIHGNRLNRDVLKRQGSGYKSERAKDFLFANDPWFRGIAVHHAPDGGVFVSDWCDTGAGHNYDH